MRSQLRVAHLLPVVLADDVLGERDVSSPAGLQRDGIGTEVFQHIVDVWEPQVLDSALAGF